MANNSGSYTDNILLYDAVTDLNSLGAGNGGAFNQIQTVTREFDRFHANAFPLNAEHAGLTFITRPKLNLHSGSIVGERRLKCLDTTDPLSTAFYLRCLLDTKFAYNNEDLVKQCPLINYYSPFNALLSNSITDITGFPDFSLDFETTDGGYQSENYSFPIGSDMCRKSHDISINVRDIPNGTLTSMFLIWILWIHLMNKGIVSPYKRDSDELVMPFTVSIYRFTLDVTRYRIVKWSKSTGCTPKSLPIGAMFNRNSNEIISNAATKFTVPFNANFTEYCDPISLAEFNMLVKRYNGKSRLNRMVRVTPIAANNFVGIPFVLEKPDGHYLEFIMDPTENTQYMEQMNKLDEYADYARDLAISEEIDRNFQLAQSRNVAPQDFGEDVYTV